jgi:GntR family transcriptional regulator
MPTPQEVETLRLASGVPVFSITRRMISERRVLEMAADLACQHFLLSGAG